METPKEPTRLQLGLPNIFLGDTELLAANDETKDYTIVQHFKVYGGEWHRVTAKAGTIREAFLCSLDEIEKVINVSRQDKATKG